MPRREHVKNIYGDDGKIIFKQYRIDGEDYLLNRDGTKIRLEKLMSDVEAFSKKGVHVIHPKQILEIVDTDTQGTIATVSTSEMVFTPDGGPMTEVSILSNKYGVNVLDIEDDEEEEEEVKKPYDFKLVERDDGTWLEWYDENLVDHGVDVYSLAVMVEDIWNKKKAKENSDE